MAKQNIFEFARKFHLHSIIQH